MGSEMCIRDSYYSEADIVVETREEQVDNTVLRVIDAIDNFLSSKKTA